MTTFSKLYACKMLVQLKSLLANTRVKRSGLGAKLTPSIRRLLETHGPPPSVMAKKKKDRLAEGSWSSITANIKTRGIGCAMQSTMQTTIERTLFR